MTASGAMIVPACILQQSLITHRLDGGEREMGERERAERKEGKGGKGRTWGGGDVVIITYIEKKGKSTSTRVKIYV